MSKWAIDLGTTNSVLARWDRESESPELIHLGDVCRQSGPDKEIEVKYAIPSSLYLLPERGIKELIGSLPFFQQHFFIGKEALIGRAAVEKDCHTFAPPFISGFKSWLLRDSYKTLTKFHNRIYTARQAALIFMRELFALTKKNYGERPRQVIFSVPVDCFEPYRANLKLIARKLGIKKFQTIDEPVAAAIGYGLRVDEPQYVMVIDFGGGTLDLAIIKLEEKSSEIGKCRVVAKAGAPVGGNTVDGWLVEAFCKNAGYDLEKHSSDPNISWWYRLMLEEACRVKESLFFKKKETFYLTPPDELKNFEARVFTKNSNLDKPFDLSKEDLVDLLEENGLFRILDSLLEDVLAQAENKGIYPTAIREVLMVGGSTLLPDIYSRVEKQFGRDKVRAWQPFNAVAYGASVFSAGKLIKSDFITHDYAFITYNSKTHKPEYNVIIPRGTPFPTIKEFWKRHLTPTCPLGEPETIFKLVICEIGKRHFKDQEFIWDSQGNLHSLNQEEESKSLIIPLNESNPTLGTLSPPHSPGDKSARLQISFMVNEDRWLCTSVFDLKTRKSLLVNSPVIRLK